VTNLATPSLARDEAGRLLDTSTDRWRHVVGVAKAARAARAAVAPEDIDLLVAAAWLHDIGYAPEVARTGFHPLDGARHLRARGAPDRLCRLVAHHTASIVEAKARGMANVLVAEFPPEHSDVADALTYADMTTGPAGQQFMLEERLNEILRRYPSEHVVHRAISGAIPELSATVEKVAIRLQVGQPM
jgi:putative nucleotidyltransferase with HDIG domain